LSLIRVPGATTARSYCIPFTTITDDSGGDGGGGGSGGVLFNDAVNYYDYVASMVDCEFRPRRDDVTGE